jgi:thimet oligopeptidase
VTHRFLLGAAALAAFGVLAVPAAAAAPDGVNWHLTAAQIKSSCASVIKQTDARLNAIVRQRSARTFDTVVLPLENAAADLNDKLVYQTFADYVSPDAATRDASEACTNDVGNYYNAMSARPDLEQAVAAAQKSGTAKTVYDKKLTDLWLTSFKRSGASLAPAARAEFVKLSNQLNQLGLDFSNNLQNDKTTITLTQAQTDGIPADLVAGFKKNADGTYTVDVNESTAGLTAYANDESARKAFSIAYNNRGGQKNVAILEQAIAVRDRLAHLMGYENWAAYQLADRMAGTPARVFKFLGNLDAAILPKARAEFENLRQLKAADTKNPNAVLNAWDVGHYDHILNKTQYSVDTDAIRQYFPVQHTIDAVLNIYHTLLTINFTQVKNSEAWLPEVLEYKVTDGKTGKLLGYTYFDLYPRPGKFEHFANWPLLPYRKMADGSRVPIAAILGNWPKPGPGQPALLSHEDVVTFFHEFGHNLAALLATAPYETLSAGFRQDFVEAPSQMLENFVWQPSVLKQISSNWKTGEPLPDDLIAKMTAAKYVDYAYFTTRQIQYATVDMDYHTMGPHVDTTAVWAKVASETTPFSMVPGTLPQASFGHLFGYDAGYYSYLWALVYAQDMFTAFQKGGIESPVVGARYRSTILQPARTLEPDVEVQNFLGRPMSPAAFYAIFGITDPSQSK